jgi:hypothetical protein
MIFKKNMLNILLISLVVIIFGRLFYVENYCNIDESKTYVTVDDLQARGHYENRRDELIGELRNSYHDMCYECLNHFDDEETCNSLPHCSSTPPAKAEPTFTIGTGTDDFVCNEAVLTEDERHAEHRKMYRDDVRLNGGILFYQNCLSTVPTEHNDYSGYDQCMVCMRENHGVREQTTTGGLVGDLTGNHVANESEMEDFCNMNEIFDDNNRHVDDSIIGRSPNDVECVGPKCN